MFRLALGTLQYGRHRRRSIPPRPLRRRNSTRTNASRARAAPPPSIDAAAASERGAEFGRRSRDHEQRPRAFTSAMSRNAPFSPASTAWIARAFVERVAAGELLGPARAMPRSSGSTSSVRRSPSTSSCTVLVVVVVSSSSPSSPWKTIARSVPSSAQRAEHLRRHRLVAHADRLAAHACRVRQRTEKVERRRHAELLARRAEEPHRRVVARREAEADAGLPHATRDAFGAELDRDAERLEHVGRTALRRLRPVAVLHDFRTRAGRDRARPSSTR